MNSDMLLPQIVLASVAPEVMFWVGVGIAAVLVVLAIVAIAQLFQLRRQMQEMRSLLPGNKLLTQVAQTNHALSHALEVHQQTLQSIPDLVSQRVAGAVESGLAPLQQRIGEAFSAIQQELRSTTGSLSSSHNELNQAFLTFNENGHFSEWVGTLREGVLPLQKTAIAVEDHYNTSRNLLRSTSELMQKWSGHWETIEHCFVEFNTVVAARNAQDATQFANIEHRILNRLEEVAISNAEVSKNLSELQSSTKDLSGAHASLGRTLMTTVNQIGELMESSKRIQTGLEGDIEKYNEFQQAFQKWQTEVQERIGAFEAKLEKLVATVHQLLRGMHEEFHKTLANSAELMKRSAQLIQHTAKHMSETSDAVQDAWKHTLQLHNQVLTEQANVWERMQSVLSDLPSRNIQTTLVIVAIIQAVILGVCAYALLR